VGDREIHKLNSSYRNKDKPTDVLSFSQLEGELGMPPESLGDVVISLDTSKKQAKEYGVTIPEEILRLLVHGVLHLCGFDHENVPQAKVREMQRYEDMLFSKCVRDCGEFV
jgi:probable rRNA maturation factor